MNGLFLACFSLAIFSAPAPNFVSNYADAGAITYAQFDDTKLSPRLVLVQSSTAQSNVDEALVKKAETAMSGLNAVRGRFSQTDWDGTRQLGRFALQKKGKLRFDYSDQTLLVISDGVTLFVKDRELETTDSVPLAATPLGTILSGNTNFRNTTEIVKTHKAGAHYFVSVRDKGDEWNGTLTLKFELATDQLSGWITLDETGAGTSVDLYEVDYNPKLNPRLFIIQD